jgi:hypothetical protein
MLNTLSAAAIAAGFSVGAISAGVALAPTLAPQHGVDPRLRLHIHHVIAASRD